MSDRCSMRQCFFYITKQYRGGILKIEEAIDSYRAYFGEGEIEMFSAPGRSEIGGICDQ